MVAAAAVCTARIRMNLTPHWTARLEAVSHCSMQVLDPVVELFGRLYNIM